MDLALPGARFANHPTAIQVAVPASCLCWIALVELVLVQPTTKPGKNILNRMPPTRSCDSSTPSPPPSNLPAMTAANAVPQWAIAMASATPTPNVFNFDAALSINSILHGTKPPPTTTTDQSSQALSAAQQTSSATSPSSTDDLGDKPNSTLGKSNLFAIKPNLWAVLLRPNRTCFKIKLQSLIGVGLFYLQRRRRGHAMAQPTPYNADFRAGNQSPSPYQPVHNGHSDSVDSSVGKVLFPPAQMIDRQPSFAQAEDLKHLMSRVVGDIAEGSGPPPDWEAQMRAAREQINILTTRMNAMDSGLGMEMGSEAPPEYASQRTSR
ncbi:hypothetical protein MSAN_01017000 [Mycena sanguinolenta]|uniref:Uncharacterized protein n=1 Tax=Mycena sanguinolenta TaxID=230812 RepID=A0A8H6YRQ5_9AGAR|nr:hypothetical protein MSAN_01017000 [Mycena sanguinolenta]